MGAFGAKSRAYSWVCSVNICGDSVLVLSPREPAATWRVARGRLFAVRDNSTSFAKQTVEAPPNTKDPKSNWSLMLGERIGIASYPRYVFSLVLWRENPGTLLSPTVAVLKQAE